MRNSSLLELALRRTLLAALCALAPVSSAEPGSASPDFQLTVQQGDTLTGLGQRWLADPKRWPELQRHNKIPDPNRLVPGSTIVIPAALLRDAPGEVTVSNVSGQARKADGTPVAAGDRLREGAIIQTAENGYATLQLVDGSTLRLQAKSDLKIERARRLPGSDATEARFQLQSGQAEVQVKPAASKASRFEIRTGFASAAGRGAEFRVSASDGGTRTEVTAGTIAFAGLPPNAGAAAPEEYVSIPEGFGSMVDESRKPIAPVRLLAAPALPREPVFQRAPTLRLSFPPVEGAASYRAWLAKDEDFRQMVGEAVLSKPEASFSGQAVGAYVLKIRAIDQFGLEGRDAIAIFGITAGEQAAESKTDSNWSTPAKKP